MRRPLRLYYVCKGEQKVNIGDSIKDMLDSWDCKSYDVLDWTLDAERLEELLDQVSLDIRCKKMCDNGRKMINSNIYLTTSTGTIVGIIPINHRSHLTPDKELVLKEIPDEVRFDFEEDYLMVPKAKLLELIKKYEGNNYWENGWLLLSKEVVLNPTKDFVDGYQKGFNEALELFKELLSARDRINIK